MMDASLEDLKDQLDCPEKKNLIYGVSKSQLWLNST